MKVFMGPKKRSKLHCRKRSFQLMCRTLNGIFVLLLQNHIFLMFHRLDRKEYDAQRKEEREESEKRELC